MTPVPCSPGMLNCAATCGHRRFVLDYVAERDAQAVRAERTTKGHVTEQADYYGATGQAVEQRVTFQRWLTTHARADYPYPRATLAVPTWLDGYRGQVLDAVA